MFPTLLITALFIPLFLANLQYELMFFQQNSYRYNRYLRSIRSMNLPRYSSGWIIMLTCLLLKDSVIALSIIGVVSLCLGLFRWRKKYKKPLVYTARVKRLLVFSIFLVTLLAISSEYFAENSGVFLSVLVTSFLTPLLVIIANILLSPIDKAINRYYYNDAKRILSNHPNLTIIGITGSYGKTSAKHYLERILSETHNVLMTPGNFNTTLGVILTIRQHLKPYHNVFIVEMGAKQLGDIADICRLVNPSIGIITSVGEQHLETFKSIQNVQRTKFELVDSLPQEGLAVLNTDYEFVSNRDMKQSQVRNISTYASKQSANADYSIGSISINENGKTCFDILYKGELKDSFVTNLLGSYNLSNLLACYIVAKEMGCSTKEIANAIKDIHPVEHRLSIKRMPNGITVLDDAYNSNPQGSKMALEVLGSYPGNKKHIITPGMIELGEKQEEYNENLGTHIGTHADYAYIVGQYNRNAILRGIGKTGMAASNVFECADLNEAVQRMNAIANKGDIVLYENDLPDTFR